MARHEAARTTMSCAGAERRQPGHSGDSPPAVHPGHRTHPAAGPAAAYPGVGRGVHDTAPAARWEDCYLTGNGRHGALVHGGTADETVIVTHHAMVRPGGGSGAEPPHLAPVLRQVQDALLAGDQATAVRLFAGDWDIIHPQPFHPAFAVRLHRTDARPATCYRRWVDFRTGVVSAGWQEGPGEGEWRSSCFVSRVDDVVVQHLAAPPGRTVEAVVELDGRLAGSPPELRLAVRSVYRPGPLAAPAPGAPAAPAAHPAHPAHAVHAVPPAPRDSALLRLRARYPDSEIGYRGATRVIAVGGEVVCDGPRVRVTGARELLLLTRTARGPVAGTVPDGGPAAARWDELSRLDTGMYELPDNQLRLLARHVPLHRQAFERVTLDLGGEPAERALPVAELLERQAATPGRLTPVLLEHLFAAGRYHLLSASGHRPPRLCGLWTGDWNTAWSGAFTTNANLNLQIASAAAADLPEASLAHAELVLGQLEDWRTNARLLYGTRGVVAPAHSDGENGLQYHFSTEWAHHMWTAGADWLLQPLLEYAETFGDEAFLTGRLLPALVEVAVFYEDFLTRSTPDGRVLVVPSYSPENHPADADGSPSGAAASVNATMDIAAARHALTTAAELCRRYRPEGITPERTVLWQQLAARLPDYRVNEDGALAEWAWSGHRDGYDHRHVSHLYPVWPLDEINPEDTPGLAEAARTALRLRGDENDSGHGYLHRALAAARLEDTAGAARNLSRLLDRDFFYRSLMSSHYPYRNVYNADVAHALPAVLIEMLVRSRPAAGGEPARLTLLPALPGTLPRGVLRGVRTRFGATVRELRWDLDAGRLEAVLRCDTAQRVALRTGRQATAVRLGPDALRPVEAHGGAVLLEAGAGEEVRVTAELAAAVPR